MTWSPKNLVSVLLVYVFLTSELQTSELVKQSSVFVPSSNLDLHTRPSGSLVSRPSEAFWIRSSFRETGGGVRE